MSNMKDENGDPMESEVEVDEDRQYEIADEGELPFACFICRDGFREPVVTLCSHYFCNSCAVSRFKSGSTRCAACDKPTFGVFNKARKLIKHLEKVKGCAAAPYSSLSSASSAPDRTSRRSVGSWETVQDSAAGTDSSADATLSNSASELTS